MIFQYDPGSKGFLYICTPVVVCSKLFVCVFTIGTLQIISSQIQMCVHLPFTRFI